MTTESKPSKEMVLAEYAQLKTEQVARIGFRDNLIYATLVAIAGTLTITHSSSNHAFLLLVAPAAFVLGWTYLANDNMITAIGRYVREHQSLAMGWETDHPADRRRTSRKTIQLCVDLTTFCGSGLAALIAFWMAPDSHSGVLVFASVIELIAVLVLAQQLITYASDSLPKWHRAPGSNSVR